MLTHTNYSHFLQLNPRLATMSLPCEMLDEILIRLPVKDLLRARCVSKGWCSLIDSTPFVKRHLSANAGAGSLLIRGSAGIGNFYLASFNAAQDEATALEINDPLKTLLVGARIQGAANGLVCVSKNNINQLFLINPATNKSRMIPSAPQEFPRSFYYNESSVCGFGYDHINDDYKVVKIADCFIQFRGIMAIVYSLKTNSWKRIHNVPSNTRFTRDSGAFADGALYWLGINNPVDINDTCCKDFLVVFDLGLDQFKEILIPAMKGPVVSFSTRCVDSDGRSLCIIDSYPDCHTDLWLMNNSGAEIPWSKLLSVENHRTQPFRFFRPVYFSRSGESVLLEVDNSKLVWYDLGKKAVKNFLIRGIPNKFSSHVYTESLVKLTEDKLLQKPSQDKPEIKQQKRR